MAWLPSILYMILLFVFSSVSDPVPAGLAGVSDKLLHVGGYAPLGMLLVRSYANAEWSRVGRRSVLSAVVTGIVYAASDEFHQYFTAGRKADAIDLLVDSIGVSAGAAAVWTWGIIRSVRAV